MIMHLARSLGILLLAQAGALAQVASPSPTPACIAPDWTDVEIFRSLSSMSPAVVRDFTKRLAAQGEPAPEPGALIAERDAPWQASDVVIPGVRLPLSRFIFGVRDTNRWFLWHETGGSPRAQYVTIFDVDPSKATVSYVARLWAPELDDLCKITLSLLPLKGLPDKPPEPDGK